MKQIRIEKIGNYTHHGIGYTEHDGYSGTCDNRMSITSALWIESRSIKDSEQYSLMINGVDKGIFTKSTKETR